jgi:hypothetical protein
MFYQDAKQYLDSQFEAGDRLVLMVLTEREIRQVVGDSYPLEDLVHLMELISRTPKNTDDIDQNYWYEQKGLFRKLVEVGYNAIERSKIEDDIRERNQQLQEELGLENIIISVDHEVRPLKVINPDSYLLVQQFGETWFQLPQGSTYADLLLQLDRFKKDDGHHVFYEGAQMSEVNGESVLSVGFGS